MASNRILRVSCFVDLYGHAQLSVVELLDDGRAREVRHEFADAHQVLDAAEKMRLVGNDMLRLAPRPAQPMPGGGS